MTQSAGPALKQLYLEYGGPIGFVTLYVREAHPGERCPQPETFEEKLEHARMYKERDGIPWTVAVDDIHGTLHHELDLKPNSAYVMDSRGYVVFRSLWANDERPLREALDAVSTGRAPPRAQYESRVVPMLRGMGVMHENLGLAGRVAQRDALLGMAPVYGLSRLAALFRPLSPLGRGIAATATCAVGLSVAGGLIWIAASRRRRAREEASRRTRWRRRGEAALERMRELARGR